MTPQLGSATCGASRDHAGPFRRGRMEHLRRIQFVELEDLPWWPAAARDLSTDYLRFMESRFALHRPVVPLLAAALRATGARPPVGPCPCGARPEPRRVRGPRRPG